MRPLGIKKKYCFTKNLTNKLLCCTKNYIFTFSFYVPYIHIQRIKQCFNLLLLILNVFIYTNRRTDSRQKLYVHHEQFHRVITTGHRHVIHTYYTLKIKEYIHVFIQSDTELLRNLRPHKQNVIHVYKSVQYLEICNVKR